jgi:hypothetical protein
MLRHGLEEVNPKMLRHGLEEVNPKMLRHGLRLEVNTRTSRHGLRLEVNTRTSRHGLRSGLGFKCLGDVRYYGSQYFSDPYSDEIDLFSRKKI